MQLLERAGLTEGSWHGNGEGPGKQGTKRLENFASLQEEERTCVSMAAAHWDCESCITLQ